MRFHEVTVRFDLPFSVQYVHRVRFTRDVFDSSNTTLAQCVTQDIHPGGTPARVLAFVDTAFAKAIGDLPQRLRRYFAAHPEMTLVGRVQPVVGGELAKNDRDAMYRVLNAINNADLDRQSYVLVIGGGAVLDCVGFAAAIAHRGVRLIRLPTTTLSQADSGVGVKNGINGFEQKNYLGSFTPPWAVVNDVQLLATLCDGAWRDGFSEAVKVAALKDPAFFADIVARTPAILARDLDAAEPVIARSAELHLRHITQGGDPFELTSARPLDFGHWSAHKLEQLTDFAVSHGQAVAIGLALDCTYATLAGLMNAAHADAIIGCLSNLGFTLWHPRLNDTEALLGGLDEFRRHLGGRLTITLLRRLGEPVDVHEIDQAILRRALARLAPRHTVVVR